MPSPSATEPLSIRPATPSDADACGRIYYDAFAALADRHRLPIEPESREFTQRHMVAMLTHPRFHGLVAERGGQLIATGWADERASITGIGPLVVDPSTQDRGVGRALMEELLARQRERGVPGVRLVQTAYHYRSLALYAKLGFVVRELLSVLQGKPPGTVPADYTVRPASQTDVSACQELCLRVHGHEREHELRDAIAQGTAHVVEHLGRISGYATGVGYGWHAVAETNEELKALLASSERLVGLGVLVPSRNAELLRWCLANGLHIVQQSTLMTIGLYNEPDGAYLPSISF
jgi:predicted N-acetyltransferase YhbS